ncbi:two-component system regulatory protein [Glaciecola punicea ACAM 611]|jgi:DNA-binding NarL/FixJ family response regulator|uniref:Two-component system regulatory protein n=1 Tax=Glaciecola punicea ACAM 611 TaxID=1121923 RepID=H5T8G9_9ALTE|nr:response regulator transcription factor [Glaciecola punicea]OFA30514.1 DNA-binding response regulator [Glaciecola punicea]GAB54610.1 two-component system regulatory protein [Glaciecola punicea ACAM 611]
MIRVLLVDDQTLVRHGIKSLLGLSPFINVVGEAENGVAALAFLDHNSALVDVVLMDIRMPKLNGIEALIAMREKQIKTPVIMLTTFDDHESLMQAIKSGAKGYLLKDVSLETLVLSIETVHNGDTLIQPAITERLIAGLQGIKGEFESAKLPEPLSKRETEILRLMAAGCSNKEMADSLCKSQGTIKNQVSSILSKLGVRDRTRAVLKAIELGVI